MMINTIANVLRTKNNEPLTVEMLEAELKEALTLRAKTPTERMRLNWYIKSLKSNIRYKQNRQP